MATKTTTAKKTTAPIVPAVQTTDNGGQFRIVGKTLIWIPEQWEGEAELPEIHLPLRIKVKAYKALKTQDPENPMEQLDMLAGLFPSQKQALHELDLLELADLFGTWSREFQNRNQVALGEA